MKHYTVTIKPLSPFVTPLDSDTLFGHICWAMSYLPEFRNEKSLETLLRGFAQTDGFPLVLSSALPRHYLPFPLLPPLDACEKTTLNYIFIHRPRPHKKDGSLSHAHNELDFIQWLKQLSKQRYISLETFREKRDNFSKFQIYHDVLEEKLSMNGFSPVKDAPSPEAFVGEEMKHNAINRITGQVIEGHFFSRKTVFYPPDARLVVYLKTSFFTPPELETLFRFIGQNGFGGDKSTGCGRFEAVIDEGTPFDAPGADNDGRNAHLLLSMTHPSVLKQYETVYYRLRTKFGKVGGYAPQDRQISPFKNPTPLLEPGAVIFTAHQPDYFGELFDHVHPQWGSLRHYGVAFPVSLKVDGEP